MKKPFFYEAKSETEVDIHIFGAIGEDEAYWNQGTNNTAYALVSLIKRLDKTYSRINVHINSPGGYIDDGLAIYNTLKAAKADVHTYNAGLVASMASIIILAGTTHFPKTSLYHLHSASTITIGNIKDHEEKIASLKVFENALQEAISAKIGLTIEEIQAKWFDGNEHYMSAATASEIGFVDFLEEVTVEPPAAINKLEKMSYQEVMNLYKQEVGTKREKSFLKRIAAIVKPNNNENPIDMSNTLKFKAKLTVLLALIGLQEFVLNSSNKVEIDIDEAYKINDALEAKDQEIDGLKQANTKLEEQNTGLNNRIAEMQTIIDGKPAGVAANPKGGDNSKDKDKKSVDELDDETSTALREYNKKLGLIK
ncbi:MAG: Clp protease ClpP [Bacteroidales bacterium]|nr:Clp protease ClpP [Bacteroidales bacterium]